MRRQLHAVVVSGDGAAPLVPMTEGQLVQQHRKERRQSLAEWQPEHKRKAASLSHRGGDRDVGPEGCGSSNGGALCKVV